ncbi:hypothetical protein [Actinoplanes solisilvae]|uniref:hypothetical protein n=1 Tax=Actinoplanes solisilvae TaxID=2486853 RepID=UPI000FD7B2EA|nr:hypothetical protein [Actinoplanes solisilvae]
MSVVLLANLFAHEPPGAVAFAVFAATWLPVSVINAGMGVFSAGYRASEEATVFLPVFGGPAAVAGAAWAIWPDGLSLGGPRFGWFLVAGLALWGGIALLADLLIPRAAREVALRTAAVVFVPLWFALLVVNLLIGVLVDDYSVGEEVLVFVLNVVVPSGVALAGLRLRRVPSAG